MKNNKPDDKKPATWRERLKVGANEVMYLAGLALFFAGLWIFAGIGLALLASGAVLMATALIGALAEEVAEARRVI